MMSLIPYLDLEVFTKPVHQDNMALTLLISPRQLIIFNLDKSEYNLDLLAPRLRRSAVVGKKMCGDLE